MGFQRMPWTARRTLDSSERANILALLARPRAALGGWIVLGKSVSMKTVLHRQEEFYHARTEGRDEADGQRRARDTESKKFQ